MQIAIVVLLLVAVGAAVYFYATRTKVQAKVEQEKVKYIAEGNTEELAKAKAALDEATAALKAVQEAEKRQLVEEQAAIVRELEKRLKELETAAILQPTDPAIVKEAEETEIIAQGERAELEERWKAALFEAHRAMGYAHEAADIAAAAYEEAKKKVAYWENQVAVYRNAVLQAEHMLATLTVAELRKDWETRLALYRGMLEKSEKNVVVARNDATAVRVEAVACISKADDCAEAVLRLTGDIRVLGILLSLCDRVDAIAAAVRRKLAEMEGKVKE